MQKVWNYIIDGKGMGLKYLSAFALLSALIISVILKIGGDLLVPYAQDVAEQMLPIRIENGIVVEPYNTLKTAKIRLDDSSDKFTLPLVIDTRYDTLDTNGLQQGVYMTRTTLYTVNNNEVRVVKLKDNMYLPQGDYTAAFKSFLNWGIVLFFVFATAMLFFLYFILSLFYAVCAIAVAAVAGRRYEFDQRMRLSALSLIAAYIIFWPLDFAGFGMGRFAFFLVVLIIQGLVIYKLPARPRAAVEPSLPAAAQEKAGQPEMPAAPVLKAPLKKAPLKKAPGKKALMPKHESAAPAVPAKDAAEKPAAKGRRTSAVKKTGDTKKDAETAVKKAKSAKKQAAAPKAGGKLKASGKKPAGSEK